jgi:pSer/pThr/pTyr-binding forkhead associated (FHA) protein
VPVKEVSRRHAEIVAEEHDYVLRDLDSPNGTFVNGARIVEHRLKEGDKLTVGGKVFLFKQQ